MSYCSYVREHPEDILNKNYHDNDYGFAIGDDDKLFERLVFEINQAGLSWITILRKADNFRAAYSGFSIARVAAYTDADRERLMNYEGVIRNRLKINAAIVNARKILELQKAHGSFKAWLDIQGRLDHAAWVKVFKKEFVFTGPEIVKEFLMSTGYLDGAHDDDCPTGILLRSKLPPAGHGPVA